MGYHNGTAIHHWQEIRQASREEASWERALIVNRSGKRLLLHFDKTGEWWEYETKEPDRLNLSSSWVEIHNRRALLRFGLGGGEWAYLRVGRVGSVVPVGEERQTQGTPELDELFGRIGEELRRRLRGGDEPLLCDAAYAALNDLASDVDGLVDEICQKVWDMTRTLIGWRWDAGFPGNGYAAIEAVRLTSTHQFMAFSPNEDAPNGTDWQIVGEIDDASPESTISAALFHAAYGTGVGGLGIPTNLAIAHPLTGAAIRDSYWHSLHGRLSEDDVVDDWAAADWTSAWPQMSEWVESQTGSPWPVRTKEERSELLHAYIDLTVDGP